MEFEPIILRYEGLDADDSLIDLGQVGQSLQGASRILGSAGSLVETGEYARKAPALAVRVLAGTAKQGTWEIPAFLISIHPAAMPMLPIISDVAKTQATRAVTAIVNFVLARNAGRKGESQMALELADKALTEMGRISHRAIEAVERIAANQQPSVRLFVTPIGETCRSVMVGKQEAGAIVVDGAMRAAIEARPPGEITPVGSFHIFISELDLKNRSCKFSLRDDDDADRRYQGDIIDPIVLNTPNPYSDALAAKRWISVQGKAALRDGELERLYISDVTQQIA